MSDVIAHFGPRCETLDPDGFLGQEGRCPCCLAWEQYDELRAHQTLGADGQTLGAATQDTAAELARLRAEVERLTKEGDRLEQQCLKQGQAISMLTQERDAADRKAGAMREAAASEHAKAESARTALSDERRHADELAEAVTAMDLCNKLDCEMRGNVLRDHRARRQG